jgi:hypothetical protein
MPTNKSKARKNQEGRSGAGGEHGRTGTGKPSSEQPGRQPDPVGGNAGGTPGEHQQGRKPGTVDRQRPDIDAGNTRPTSRADEEKGDLP